MTDYGSTPQVYGIHVWAADDLTSDQADRLFDAVLNAADDLGVAVVGAAGWEDA